MSDIKLVNRDRGLDYLRGLCAFGIMIYHYSSWVFHEHGSDTILGRIGIYGVSLFYILSGLTLHNVYCNKQLFSFENVHLFFRKRIFRIYPLLWIATILTAIGNFFLISKTPDFIDVFLNLTGLFGFFRWDSYIATGAWSIGNELVFYTFFPVLWYGLQWKKWLIIILSAIIFFSSLYFSFFLLRTDLILSQQWKNYVNPLNQSTFFLTGFLVGIFLKKENCSMKVTLLFLLTGITLFVFTPKFGDVIYLVTGFNRYFFTLSCILITIGFYRLPNKNFIFSNHLELLGSMSYSVYLLHPIVYYGVLTIFKYILKLPKSGFSLGTSVILTLICSYYVFTYFERFFIILNNKITNRNM